MLHCQGASLQLDVVWLEKKNNLLIWWTAVSSFWSWSSQETQQFCGVKTNLLEKMVAHIFHSLILMSILKSRQLGHTACKLVKVKTACESDKGFGCMWSKRWFLSLSTTLVPTEISYNTGWHFVQTFIVTIPQIWAFIICDFSFCMANK